MAKYSYEQMIEKLVRAKVQLEQVPRKMHPVSCPAEQGDGPCICGADQYNASLRAALKELEI